MQSLLSITPPPMRLTSLNRPDRGIRSTLEALRTGQSSPAEVIDQAATIAQSGVCRHVYMPGYAPSIGNTDLSEGLDLSLPLAGIPVSIKDLFDVAGQTTAAGSTVLAQAPAAQEDSPAVARLRAAGAVLAGRTNMVEFAFSGVGLNPHYGTPANPAGPAGHAKQSARIPGGSSSGAAVSVATGAALVGLGTDTGGSIRIPAALCGIVGFKSTARLVPTTGVLPLSTSLDTVCALTRSVQDAITVHEVLAARRVRLAGRPLSSCRLAVARTVMQDGLDSTVSHAFDRSLRILSQAGMQIEEIALTELDELPAINASGGLSSAESYAWHRHLLAQHQADYDPRVALRILRGASMTAHEYIDLLAARHDWINRMQARLSSFDAVLSPTVPIIAPLLDNLLIDDAEFFRINSLLLRNTAVVNMLDGCAISLPCHSADQWPVGLMLWQASMQDDVLLDLAVQVQAALAASLQK